MNQYSARSCHRRSVIVNNPPHVIMKTLRGHGAGTIGSSYAIGFLGHWVYQKEARV